jgi:uncharacterized protein YqeY
MGIQMIYETLKQISIELRKQRSPLASTAQFHLAEIQKIGKNLANRETSEDEAIQYIKKAVQRLKDDKFSSQEEVRLLEPLLPKMMSEEEMLDFISCCENLSKGDIMKVAKREFGSAVDMRRLSQLIK